jgi:hypothetical protein
MSNIRLYFKSIAIRDQGNSLCLTDMWRAAEDEGRKRPSDWLALESAREFREYLETTLNQGSLVETTEGRSGATWAHWQLAMAYAKYLSPAFHAWCNDVVRKVMQGELTGGVDARELTDLRSEVRALAGNLAACWSHISSGGYIAPARFKALRDEWHQLAEVEVAVGMWPVKPPKPGKRARSAKSASLADIQRELREGIAWGGKAKPLCEMPAAAEPYARAIIKRRMKDATRRGYPGAAQLELVKTG